MSVMWEVYEMPLQIGQRMGEGTIVGVPGRIRAKAYDQHLAVLRRKRSTYQGGYLHAVQQEAEETHCKWLLANQEAFAEEVRLISAP